MLADDIREGQQLINECGRERFKRLETHTLSQPRSFDAYPKIYLTWLRDLRPHYTTNVCLLGTLNVPPPSERWVQAHSRTEIGTCRSSLYDLSTTTTFEFPSFTHADDPLCL